jgi:hypothetical protein
MVHQGHTAVIMKKSTSAQWDWLLLRGIRNIIRCDQAEVVQGIAAYIISQHRSLRLLSALIERTRNTPIPGVIALIGWLRSFLSVQPGDRSDGAVWIARLSNERGTLEMYPQLATDLHWTELKFRSWPNTAALYPLACNLGPRRIFKIVRRLHRRYEFFKVLRVVELLGYYARYCEIFRRARFSIAVMSSHSNPHGIAFNLAARKSGVPVLLITHGMPVRPIAKLAYDFAVVHCEAARQMYLEDGCQMDRVLLHGRRQHHVPMPDGLPERLVVGIFLCKDVNEQRLREVVQCLRCHPRVSRILIRPHPKNLWLRHDRWIASLNDAKVRRSWNGSVIRDVEGCDIVLGGNSSVLVNAVIAGRPTGYVPGLDHGSADLHAFVGRGLIYPIDNNNGRFCLDPEALLSFYQRPAWPTVLRLFANVDETEESVAVRTIAIVRDIAKPAFSPGAVQPNICRVNTVNSRAASLSSVAHT